MIITLDFETFFDDEYSLKKMTTEAYVRDARFKIHGLAIKLGAAPARWYKGDGDVPADVWTAIDNGIVLAHHAQFDGLILSHHLDTRPAMWLDTLSMARIAFPHDRHSLDNLSKICGLPGKQYQMLANVKGVRDPNANMLAGLGSMSCDDADKTYAIFQQIKDCIPREEYRVIDATIRMFTEPCLNLDVPKMQVYYAKVRAEKQTAQDGLGLTKKDLGQDEIVAAKYRELGVEPEKKVTGKGNEKYAFAKTDQFMRDMLEDADDAVVALTEARLGVKSTIDETRCERLLSMSTRGALCVYLRYCGAHPTRWSGGDKMNWQNYRRNEKDGRPGEIRGSIIAPPGKKIVVADESQVECRVLNWLAGQEDVLQKFRNKEDPYIGIASQFYGFPVTKANPKERGTGKQLELSCLGPDTLVLTDQGYIPIIDVTTAQRLWDGREWVIHQGVVARGKKRVMLVCGVQLTPDHRVLCGNMWKAAQNLQNENTLSRALESASEHLPSQATKWALRGASLRLSLSATAEHRNTLLTLGIFMRGVRHAAIHALKKLRGIGLKNTTVTPTLFLRTIIDAAYLDASPQLLTDAPTQRTATTEIMEGVASPVFGGKIVARSLPILSNFAGPSILKRIWTALTTAKAMSLETCASFRTNRIAAIDVLSRCLPKKIQTYDLAFAGPRNRYTIACAAGHLIVHNCGYGAAAASIVETAKRGTYGPPVYLTLDEGERAKDLYRSTHRAVTHLWWQTAETALQVLEARGTMTWGPMEIEHGAIWLPNDLPLYYTTFKRDEAGDVYCLIRGRWRKMWGTKLVQHVCEALARVIVSQVMLRMLDQGYRAINTTHDELMFLVDENDATALPLALSELKKEPAWAPGLPLDAEGSEGARYSK